MTAYRCPSILVTAVLTCAALPAQSTAPRPAHVPPSSSSFRERGVAPARPNVLVVMLDDVGAGESLPALAEVAMRGVTFRRAYSWPVCSSTRFASLFGRLPRSVGIGDVVDAYSSLASPSPAPDRREVSLAAALLPTHRTGLFGKWHLGCASADGRVELFTAGPMPVPEVNSGPFVFGFGEWRAGSPVSIGLGQGASGYYDWTRIDNAAIRNNWARYATDEQRDAFLAWWGATPGPKFGWLAFNAAHDPFDVPPGDVAGGSIRDAYVKVVNYLDGALLDVFTAIDWSDTLVVVCSDNGTPDEARPPGTPSGYWKGSTHEGGIRVPLVIAAPGGYAGLSSSRLVSLLDLPATVLEVLGLSSRGFDDSVSFADAVGPWTGAAERAWLMSERYDCPGGRQPQPAGYDDIAFIEGPTFYPGSQITVRLKRRIVDVDGDGPGGFEDTIVDLVSNPFERHNPTANPAHVVAPFSSARAAIRARFDAYLSSLPPRAP